MHEFVLKTSSMHTCLKEFIITHESGKNNDTIQIVHTCKSSRLLGLAKCAKASLSLRCLSAEQATTHCRLLRAFPVCCVILHAQLLQ